MAVNPMLNSGVNGMQQGIRALRDVAQDIAELNTTEHPSAADNDAQDRSTSDDRVADVAEAMVDLKLYQRQVQASARIVETADEVLGYLLDVHA